MRLQTLAPGLQLNVETLQLCLAFNSLAQGGSIEFNKLDVDALALSASTLLLMIETHKPGSARAYGWVRQSAIEND